MVDVTSPLFAEAPDGILLVERSGVIRAANPAANAMFGYEDLAGVLIEALVPDDVRPRHEALRDGFNEDPHPRRMGAGLSLRARRHDGTTFPVDIALTPIGDGVTAAVVRDTTDLERTVRRMDEQESALAILEDRERIARDLHDTVIQEVFAAGLKLNAIARKLDPEATDEAQNDVRAVAQTLDGTIDRLRRTIFDIRRATPGHVAEETREIVLDMIRHTGLDHVDIEVSPEVERISPRAVEHLLSTVREAVANVVKHAEATRLGVNVTLEDGWCTLEVVDNGVGLSATGDPGFGLENMRRRSEALGGSFTAAADDTGTRVVWQVPVGSRP
jgi:two-component system sensor histidine kinase DevS